MDDVHTVNGSTLARARGARKAAGGEQQHERRTAAGSRNPSCERIWYKNRFFVVSEGVRRMRTRSAYQTNLCGRKMDYVREIQEVVDENRSELPTGVVTRVMELCQGAYDAQLKRGKLYKLTWTVVDSSPYLEFDDNVGSTAQAKLLHRTQTLIVEADARPYHERLGAEDIHVPDHGLMPKSWVNRPMPFVVTDKDHTSKAIITSIVPFYKRAREE